MTIRLLAKQATATARPMQHRLASFLVMLAIFFGSIVVPATAHAGNMIAAHGGEIVAALDHADIADHDDGHEQEGDAPCHAVSHHHCSIALAVDAPALKLGFALSAADTSPPTASSMSSLSQAPPTQPPAD